MGNDNSYNVIFFSGSYDQIVDLPQKTKGSFYYAQDRNAWYKWIGEPGSLKRVNDIIILETETERLALTDTTMICEKLYFVKETSIMWWSGNGTISDWLPVVLKIILRDDNEELLGIDIDTQGELKFYSTNYLREAVVLAYAAAPKDWAKTQLQEIRDDILEKWEDINNRLNDEISNRTTAVADLRTWVENEFTRVDSDIGTERQARIDGDRIIRDKVDAIKEETDEKIESEVGRLDNRINKEIDDRIAGDAALQLDINTKNNATNDRITSEVNRLDGRINTERDTRIQEINDLTADVNDKYHQILDLIAQEEAARINDVAELKDIINTKEADILALIANEKADRISSISGLTVLVEQYVRNLEDMIHNETSERISNIEDLSDEIETYVIELKALITAEAAARVGSVTDLKNLIEKYNKEIRNIIDDEISVAITALRNDLNGHIGSGGSSHALATGLIAGFSQANFTPLDRLKLDGMDTGAKLLSGSTSIIIAANSQVQRAALTGDVTASLNSNVLTISTGAVSVDKLATDSVSTIKIVDLAVTTGKIDNGAVTTLKINDGAVTIAKITMGGNALLGRNTSGNGSPINLSADQVRAFLNITDGAQPGTVTSVAAGNGMDFPTFTTTGTITLRTPTNVTSISTNTDGGGLAGHTHALDDSGVHTNATPQAYGPTSNVTLTYSGTFTVPQITVDRKGRVTVVAVRTLTMPAIYSHPTQVAINHSNTGRTIVSDITVNTLGHVTTITTRDLAGSDILTSSTTNTITGNEVQRAALTGDVTSPSNSNVMTIATNAVTTDKINNNAVTTEKINTNAVTTEKINAGAVTLAKITMGGNAILGKNTANDGQPINLTKTQVLTFLNVADGANAYLHPTPTRANNTSTASPGSAGTFTVIDTIITNTEGHITAVNTKTVTMPTSNNNAGTVTSITPGAGFNSATVITSSGTLALMTPVDVTSTSINSAGIAGTDGHSHALNDSGVHSNATPQVYGPTADATLVNSGTFTVPQFVVDRKGRITLAAVRTFTLPAIYSHPNHSGDVTSTGDGATVIASQAVTHAKYQNITTSRILGRVSANSGSTEELTAAQVRTLINVADGANAYSHPQPTRTNNTSVATPGSGETFTAIDSITTNVEGHITVVNTKTVTIPVFTSNPGTITSISAGNGMNFTTITSSGSITLRTPADVTSTSTNTDGGASSGHTHALNTLHATVPGATGPTGDIANTTTSFTVPQITIDAKGRVTALTSRTVNKTVGTLTSITPGAGFNSSTAITSSGTLTLATPVTITGTSTNSAGTAGGTGHSHALGDHNHKASDINSERFIFDRMPTSVANRVLATGTTDNASPSYRLITGAMIENGTITQDKINRDVTLSGTGADGVLTFGDTALTTIQVRASITYECSVANSASPVAQQEEGTWTPAVPTGASISSNQCSYARVGNICYLRVHFNLVQGTAADSTTIVITGIPFSNAALGTRHTATQFGSTLGNNGAPANVPTNHGFGPSAIHLAKGNELRFIRLV